MFRRNPLVLVFVIAFGFVSAVASAQIQQPGRGYAIGFGGMGATEVNSAFFGGSVGVNVTPLFQITGDISRAQDVLAPFTKEDLALMDSGVSAITGLPLTSSVKMPTNYYIAGVRFHFPVRGNVRPYVSGGAGVAHMSPAPKFVMGGIDVSTLIMQDQLMSTTFREETRPTATVGGGVSVLFARHAMFDVGYKYSGTFIKTDYLQDYGVSPHNHDRIDTHKLYVGAGVVF